MVEVSKNACTDRDGRNSLPLESDTVGLIDGEAGMDRSNNSEPGRRCVAGCEFRIRINDFSCVVGLRVDIVRSNYLKLSSPQSTFVKTEGLSPLCLASVSPSDSPIVRGQRRRLTLSGPNVRLGYGSGMLVHASW